MSKVEQTPEQTARDIAEAARRLLIEQLEVQLAGCGVAALGHIQAPAKLGDYGWSQSYEDVLRLRLRFDKLYKSIQQATESKVPSDQTLLAIMRAWSEVRKDMSKSAL